LSVYCAAKRPAS